MSDDHPCMSSGAAALALKNHDVLCHMFEVHEDVSTRTSLSRKDLLCSSLVSRAFREPALRALWRDMSPPTPLWLLLAPRNSAAKLTSEFFDNILSERTYTDPARWARFMWYARFVQELHIITFGLEHKHKQLICALVEHNGGESIFPSLQTLSWSPSSYSDTSYFPLFTPQLRSTILDLPHSGEADKDPQSHIFLAQLRASSPRLDYLCVDVSWEHIGVNHLGVIASFEHLTDLNLVASTSLTSFRELATIPRMNSLRIAYVRSDELEPSHPLAQIHAPRLTLISVGGNCPSLTQLFTALNAPVLASASFHAISDHPLTERYADYDLCIKALTTVCSPATMEDVCIALDEDGGPQMVEYLTHLIDPLLAFRNLTRFSLSCPMVGLVADDGDFWAITRAWPKLRAFELWQAYWDRCIDPDDEDSEGVPVPTPEVLESFRDHCPDLRELVLPDLDFDGDVPTLYLGKAGSRHGLSRLVFGAKDLGGEDEEDWVRLGGPTDEVDGGKVVEWARYILGLFPKLNAAKSLAECRCMSAETGWVEVFKLVRDLRKSRTASSSGSAVAKSSKC